MSITPEGGLLWLLFEMDGESGRGSVDTGMSNKKLLLHVPSSSNQPGNIKI